MPRPPRSAAAEARLLGRPLSELKAQQAAAIRAANLNRADGTWASVRAPLRASAAVRRLTRGTGSVTLRIARQSSS